jgi:phosphoserine phosphatase RsbU/P
MLKIALAAQADHASDPARVIAGMNHAICGKFDFAYVAATHAWHQQWLSNQVTES